LTLLKDFAYFQVSFWQNWELWGWVLSSFWKILFDFYVLSAFFSITSVTLEEFFYVFFFFLLLLVFLFDLNPLKWLFPCAINREGFINAYFVGFFYRALFMRLSIVVKKIKYVFGIRIRILFFWERL
jgi:hypothetical protein